MKTTVLREIIWNVLSSVECINLLDFNSIIRIHLQPITVISNEKFHYFREYLGTFFVVFFFFFDFPNMLSIIIVITWSWANFLFVCWLPSFKWLTAKYVPPKSKICNFVCVCVICVLQLKTESERSQAMK